MSEPTTTYTITLTARQITLVRVALLQRLDRIKSREDCKESYADMRAMMDTGGLLALRTLEPTAVFSALEVIGTEIADDIIPKVKR